MLSVTHLTLGLGEGLTIGKRWTDGQGQAEASWSLIRAIHRPPSGAGVLACRPQAGGRARAAPVGACLPARRGRGRQVGHLAVRAAGPPPPPGPRDTDAARRRPTYVRRYALLARLSRRPALGLTGTAFPPAGSRAVQTWSPRAPTQTQRSECYVCAPPHVHTACTMLMHVTRRRPTTLAVRHARLGRTVGA